MDAVLLVCAGIGAVAGLFAGLLGIGGGAIMTPLLLAVFVYQGVPADQAVLAALATSLAAILFTSVPSMLVHAAHRSISWRVLAWTVPPALAGATASVWLARLIEPVVLVLILTAYLGQSVWKLLRHRMLDEAAAKAATASFRKLGYSAMGLVSGLIGPMTGTGGGVVVSSTLARIGWPLITAIGTSAGSTFFVAAAGTAGFAGRGVELDYLMVLAPVCLVFSIVGARTANVLPKKALRIVYSACMLLIIAWLLNWVRIELQP